MAAQNIISLGFNVEELSAEKKQVLDIYKDMFDQLRAYDGLKVSPINISGITELKNYVQQSTAAMNELNATVQNLNKALLENFNAEQNAARAAAASSTANANKKKTVDEATAAEREHARILEATITTQARVNAASTEAAQTLANERAQLQQRNQDLKNTAQLLTAESNSIAQARAQVRLLSAERNNLNLSTEEGRNRLIELNAAIDQNNEFIKTNSDALSQQKINIGNYAGSFKEAFSVLETELSKLREQLANGIGGDDAIRKEQLLVQLLENLSQAFSSTRQESRAFQEAAIQLGLAIGQQSEQFLAFNTAVGEARNEIEDIKAATQFQSKDNKFLVGAIEAVNGLAGAYSAATGVIELFGDEDEHLQESMKKLQALLAITTGLQQVANALQTESGAVQLALAAKTQLLNAAKIVYNALTASAIVATEAETVAIIENAEANEIASVASEEAAVAAEALAVAEGSAAVAAEAATVATVTWQEALIASGIGAIIVAIGVAVVAISKAIYNWVTADAQAIKMQEALNKIINEQNAIIQKNIELIDERYKNSLQQAQKQLDLEQASGQNQERLFVAQKKIFDLQKQQADAKLSEKIAQAEKEYAEAGVKGYEALDLAESGYLAKYRNYNAQIIGLQNALVDATKNKDDSAKKAIATRIENLSKDAEGAKKNADDIAKIRDESFKANEDLAQLQVEREKYTADQLAKIVSDRNQRRYENTIAANEQILTAEDSSYSDRLKALKGNYDAEKKLAAENVEAIQELAKRGTITSIKDNGKNSEEADQLEAVQHDLTLKKKKFLDDIDKLNQDYNDRNLTAQLAANKNEIEADQTKNEAISKDDQQQLETRFAALQQSIVDQKKLIEDDYNYQLQIAQQTGKTQDEIIAITSERDKKLLQLTDATQKEIYDIIKSYGDRTAKEIEANAKLNNSAAITETYNKQVTALNISLASRLISYTRYQQERSKLDDAYSINVLSKQVEADQKELSELQQHEQDLLKVKAEADAELYAAESSGDQNDINNAAAKLKAIQDIEKDNAAKILETRSKLGKDSSQLTDAQLKKRLEAEKLLQANVKEIEQKAFDFAKKLIDGQYEAKINSIQKQIEATDEQYSKEISAVGASSLAAQDKAALTIQLQAQQNEADKAAAKEQKKLKADEAKADRDFAAAKIVWDTASAIVATLKEFPGPVGFALAATVGALGAIELATLFATPIPAYAQGTDNHPGGLAIVGERKDKIPELVTMPDGSSFIATQPGLFDLPKGTSVTPLVEQAFQNMCYSLMTDVSGLMAVTEGIENRQRNEGWQQTRYMVSELSAAMKRNNKQIKNIVHTHTSIDLGFEAYKMEKIFGIKN